jgi:hypothetical protein
VVLNEIEIGVKESERGTRFEEVDCEVHRRAIERESEIERAREVLRD